MLSIANYDKFEEPNESFVPTTNALPSCPMLMDGALEYDTLCPVSKLTGHRTNPLSLLKMALGDKDSRLLDAILQDVPVIQQMEGVSDEDKIAMLASRHATGTFAEQDLLVKQLEKVADVLFPNQPEIKQEVENNIEFNKTDVPESNGEQL